MLRTLILAHRYVGIATCGLFVMWFGSGVVMMYVGFPQLTAVERFKGLAPLDLRSAHVLPWQALAVMGAEGWPRELRIEMVLGRPAYIVQPWEGPWQTVFADDGSVLHGVEPASALAATQHFSGVPRVRYLGLIERLDASRRWQRILFNALHSFDFPVLLTYRPAWDVVVVALSMLGIALSVTAVVIAWLWGRRLWTR